jgi:hypothetical protein
MEVLAVEGGEVNRGPASDGEIEAGSYGQEATETPRPLLASSPDRAHNSTGGLPDNAGFGDLAVTLNEGQVVRHSPFEGSLEGCAPARPCCFCRIGGHAGAWPSK